MNDTKHILESEFLAFENDLLNYEEKEKFLEHICSCNYCSGQLAQVMTKDLITAPRHMKDNILKAIKRPEVQIVVKARESSKRMQLFVYGLKVVTATIGALILLILSMNIPGVKTVPERAKTDYSEAIAVMEDRYSFVATLRNSANTLTNTMLDISNTIIKMEVIINDKKKE